MRKQDVIIMTTLAILLCAAATAYLVKYAI